MPASLTKSYPLLFILCMGGCVQNQKIDPKLLIVGIESDVKNLDPASTNDANSMHVIGLYAQRLVKASRELLPEGDLAESFSVKDGKVFTFKIPKDAAFHNGQPLTSEDVKATFEQGSGPTSRAVTSFKDLEGFETPDPQTFIIKLKRPSTSFLLGAVTDLWIQPKNLIGTPALKEHPIGSGPYKFLKRSSRDIVLERFDQVRRFSDGKLQPPPTFDRIIVRTLQDPTTRFLSLMGGDIDILINALSPKRLLEAQENSHLRIYRSAGTTYQYIGFNQRIKKLRDPRVRRALAMALNREQVIKHKFLGFAQPAASMLSPSNFFADPSLAQIPYDPEQAKKLLKEAGQENLSFELKSSTDRDTGSMLLVLKEYWEKIGVKVELRPFEFATFFADIQKGNFESYCLRWTAVADPDLMYKVYHSKEIPPGKNRIYYANSEVDKLLEQAQSEMDLKKRREIYFKAQRKIDADLPYISLWYPDNTAVTSNKLKNFELLPTASWDGFLNAHKEAP